jgi:FeS assembly SUF system protein
MNREEHLMQTFPLADGTTYIQNLDKHMTELELKEKVIGAIKTIYDPEIPVDVWELGLIYKVKIYPVNNVYVLMTLTSPNCPSAESIPIDIEEAIRKVEGVAEVSVELTFEPPYEQDMMSEVARLELGFM